MFFPRNGNKARMSAFPTVIQNNIRASSQCNNTRTGNKRHTVQKEDIKLSVVIDGMAVYAKNPRKSPRTNVSEFMWSQDTTYKNQLLFDILAINRLQNANYNTIYNRSQRKEQCFDVRLTKCVEKLDAEKNYTKFIKPKKYLNKQRINYVQGLEASM